MQKVSLLFLQETGYKRANGSQLLNKLILAKQIELCNKAHPYWKVQIVSNYARDLIIKISDKLWDEISPIIPKEK